MKVPPLPKHRLRVPESDPQCLGPDMHGYGGEVPHHHPKARLKAPTRVTSFKVVTPDRPALISYDGGAELERGLDLVLTGLMTTLTPSD